MINSSDLLLDIIKAISRHPKLRKKMLIIFVIIEVILGVILITNVFILHPYREAVFDIGIPVLVINSAILLIVVAAYFPNVIDGKSITEKLAVIESKRIEIEQNIKENDGGNVQDIIKLNLNQLDEYYTINKNQSKNSYGFSIFMIIGGFLLIVTTVIFGFINPDKYTLSIITGLAGLITEFIGATSLYLYKESTKHINEFIERLTFLQKIMLAIDLAERMPKRKKNEQIAKIIEGLISEKRDFI